MEEQHARLIPGWLWAVLAVVALGLVLTLFFTERRQEPAAAFDYDVSSYTKTDMNRVVYKESGRIVPDNPSPAAVAVAPDNRIWVACANAVIGFSPAPECRETARLAIKGRPDCIAVRPDGKILLGMRDHIEVREADGAAASVWPVLNENAYLTSIAADEENVYAADAGNRVVLRFDYEGKLLGRIGERDEAREIPGFVVPSPYFDVAIDPLGALWAVNPGKHSLDNYRPDGSLASSWRRLGMGLGDFCGCCNPTHLAFRSDGAFVTAEKGLNRVKVYGPDTKFLGIVAPPEALGALSGVATTAEGGGPTFDIAPPVRDLAVDREDRVLILDGYQKAVRIFEENPR